MFFFGLLLTAGLSAPRTRAIIWECGCHALGLFAEVRAALPARGLGQVRRRGQERAEHAVRDRVGSRFRAALHVAHLLKMDLVHACSWPMVPFILIFLFMVVFDTLGTLVA